MDLGAPADAWYVWFGVVLVTIAFAGVALSIPTQPTPDATETANTVDEIASSSFNASGSYEHNADEVRIGTKQIWLRNEGGTSHATIAFGTMTPVREHPDNVQPGIDILVHKDEPEMVFENPTEMSEWAAEARTAARNSGPEWRQATGELRVKQIKWGDKNVIFVDA